MICDACLRRLDRLAADFGAASHRIEDKETRFIVTHTLTTWAAHFAALAQESVPGQWDQLTQFVSHHVRALRRSPDALQACDEVTHALALAPR